MTQRVQIILFMLLLSLVSIWEAQAQGTAFQQAPVAPAQDGKPVLAVARLQNRLGPSLTQGVLVAADASFWTSIWNGTQTEFLLVRLETGDSCDEECIASAAREKGAALAVSAIVEGAGNEIHVSARILAADDGRALFTQKSSVLSSQIQIASGARQVATALAQRLAPSAQRSAAQYDASSTTPSPDSWGDPSQQKLASAYLDFREQERDSPEFKQYRRKRNLGLAAFVGGIVFDGVGGGVLGASIQGNSASIAVGIVFSVSGTVLFFSGLGAWISNQIKMNKIERGIPFTSRLRLEGLSPVVASREGAAPGLSAAFSF